LVVELQPLRAIERREDRDKALAVGHVAGHTGLHVDGLATRKRLGGRLFLCRQASREQGEEDEKGVGAAHGGGINFADSP
jgi:hypothetical protein